MGKMEVVFSTERNPTINVRLRGNLPLWRLSHLEITAFTGLVSEHSVLKAKKTELKNLGKGGRVYVDERLPIGTVLLVRYEVELRRSELPNSFLFAGNFFKVAPRERRTVRLDTVVSFLFEEEKVGEIALDVENLDDVERLSFDEYTDIEATIQRAGFKPGGDPVHLLWKVWMTQ